jgi:hypothetical protein
VDGSRDIAYSEALRSAVIALGCNHNYFNTEWTPGLAKAPSFDDWFDNSDPVCGSNGGSLRLSPKEQQTVGAAYTAALVRLAVKQDTAMLQLLDGSFVRPEVVGRADVATHAVGGAGYRLLYRPEDDGKVLLRSGMAGGDCLGYPTVGSSSNLLVCADGNFFDPSTTPHWQPRLVETGRPQPQATELRWTKVGAAARFDVPKRHTNFTSLDWVDIRVANDPTGEGVRLQLLVVDNRGRNATLLTNLTTVEGWPGTSILDRVHARALRGSIASVRSSKVNLNNIVAVLVVARSAAGRVWVIDVAASHARIRHPVVLNLPVVSVETITVPEGNGAKTFNVKITVDQPLKSPGSIWVSKGFSEGFQIDLAAGSSRTIAQVPYSYVGDKLYGPQAFQELLIVEALKGVVTCNFIGGFTVVEDDPAPTLSVVANQVTAKEGQSLRWQLRLSAPTTGISVSFLVTPPINGTELSSNDVPNSWLQQFVTPPSTPTPLSSLNIFLSVTFAYGVTSAILILPIAIDGTAEGDESVVFEGFDSLGGPPLTLVGKVLKKKK